MNEKSDVSLSFNEEKNDEKNEEAETVITSEQYRLRLKSIFKMLNEYLKKSKLGVRDLFKELIFRPTFEDPSIECKEDAIFLSSFVELLRTIQINIDTIDSYCIYMRLKIIENFEAISINYLEHELKNFASNGNEIDEINTSNNNLNNYETNSKTVDKLEETKNGNKNKLQEQKYINDQKSPLNEDNSSKNNNKIEKQMALIETDSEKESQDDYEESESKIESYSSEDGKSNSKKLYNFFLSNNSDLLESGNYNYKRKEGKIHNREEKYSKSSDKVREVDEEKEESYADYGFDKAVDFSIESQDKVSDRVINNNSREHKNIE